MPMTKLKMRGRFHTAVITSVFLMAFILLFSSCSPQQTEEKTEKPESSAVDENTAKSGDDAFTAFMDALDTSYSSEVDLAVSKLGDDPAYGFRGGTSPAEKQTADYVKSEMEKLGLSNITVDETNVDGWTFNGANIAYKDKSGTDKKIDLGGYQTTLQTKDEKIKVIYLGKATAEDYKGVDAKDKLVLLDIDQNEEWWINMPSYQAYVKGARAVLANSAMPVEMPDRVGTQDICGPDYAPAFGISQQDTDALKAAIDAAGGELEVTFNADSKVSTNAKGQNVWGEIPGKTDEVIYMMAHMDGYFHSYFDDASGIGLCLGVAKAMIDSGYKPDKTIRFVFHGSEEWGRTNSQCDWAIGAYEQIVNNHPEWAEKGFAVVNIDGAYSVEDETTFGIAMSDELLSFIDPLVQPMITESGYTYRYLIPASTYKEDINYVRAGIPSVATAKGEETIFYDTGYHTSADSREAMGFDEKTWTWFHQLYGRIVYAFDEQAVRPMDFTTRFQNMKESYSEDIVSDSALTAKIDELNKMSETLSAMVKDKNDKYTQAIADGDEKNVSAIRTEGIALNSALHNFYKHLQDELLWFGGEMEIIFPHEGRQANIENLRGAIAALEEGDPEKANDEFLSSVGNGWNAMFFDKETVDFFNDTLKKTLDHTWVENKFDEDGCYVDDVVRALMKKAENKDKDFTKEITELKRLEKEQQKFLTETIAKEKEGLDRLTTELQTIIE